MRSDAPSHANPSRSRITQVIALGDEPCDLCGELIAQEDISVEAFEVAGCLACTECLEALAEQGAHHE